MSAPLLNPSLLPLVRRKWLATWTGGWILAPRESSASIQAVVLLLHIVGVAGPILLGTLLPADAAGLGSASLVAIALAVAMVTLVLVVHLPLALLHRLRAAEGRCDFSHEEEITGPPLLTAYLHTFSADGKGTPRPWPHVLVSALCAGALLAGTSRYLQELGSSTILGEGAGRVVAQVFGWLSASTTLWPLLSRPPPELNTYHTEDAWGLDTYTRFLYLSAVLVLAHFRANIPFLPTLSPVGIHVAFCSLPVLFSLGLLPSARILAVVVVEGAQRVLLSAPAHLTATRDWFGARVSAVTVLLMVLPLNENTASLARSNVPYLVAAALGALCSSRALFDHTLRADKRVNCSGAPRPSPLLDPSMRAWITDMLDGFLRAGAAVLLMRYLTTSNSATLAQLQTVVIALTGSWCVAREVQAIHIPSFLPLLRNVLWTPLRILMDARPGQWRQAPLSGRGLLAEVSGGVHLLAYSGLPYAGALWLSGSMMSEFQAPTVAERLNVRTFHLWSSVMLLRAMRRVWQAPLDASLELGLLFLVNAVVGGQALDAGFPLSWWQGMQTGTKYLVVYLVKAYCLNLLSMTRLWLSSLAYYLRNRKQRRKHWLVHLLASVLLSPPSILLAAGLGSPLLAFLGLPILLPSFPRPARMWPSMDVPSHSTPHPILTPRTDEEYSSGTDSVLYTHMAPSFLRALGREASAGRIPALTAGSLYLARYESRILLVRVVEEWFEGVGVVVTGAELEPTSCHALEGNHVDVILDAGLGSDSEALEAPSGGPVSRKRCLAAGTWESSLQPLGLLHVDAFEEARNDLRGLIDDASLIKQLPFVYHKVLCVVLLRLRDPQLLASCAQCPMPRALEDFAATKYSGEWTRALLERRQEAPHLAVHYVAMAEGAAAGKQKLEADALATQLRRAVLACYLVRFGIVSTLVDTSIKSAAQICGAFQGDLPPFSTTELKIWFLHPDQMALQQASLLAFRMAVKLCVEVLVAQEGWGEEEALYQGIHEHWCDWHFGATTEHPLPEDAASTPAGWQAAIQQGKHSIYSLHRKPDGVIQERRLTLRRNRRVRLGMLNSEAARALWSNQTLELLYLNSDDDERYSIQANEMLLRNLMVSTAPSPFGYPIWVANARVDRNVGYCSRLTGLLPVRGARAGRTTHDGALLPRMGRVQPEEGDSWEEVP